MRLITDLCFIFKHWSHFCCYLKVPLNYITALHHQDERRNAMFKSQHSHIPQLSNYFPAHAVGLAQLVGWLL